MLGCDNLDIMTVVITIMQDMENGIGITLDEVKTPPFVELVELEDVFYTHTPEFGVIPGGH